MIPASDLRSALAAGDIIERYGLRAKRRGSQYRLNECPRCRSTSDREAIAIDVRTGQWLHHGHERAAGGTCSGDVLDLLAACEGLDCARDFRRVVAIAAEMTGTTSDVERELRATQAAERARRQTLDELRQRIAQRSSASSTWDRLARRDARGEAYLAQRGLDPESLIASDCVRFSRDGVVVAIRDWDGQPISTATRRYEGIPKVLALKDHSTRGTMIDAVERIKNGSTIVAIEGVADALTARLAWPDAVVLGANGAGNVPKIVGEMIVRAKLCAAQIVLVPHDDEPGEMSAIKAGKIAIAAGFELGESLHVVSLPAKDLNDAWRMGWRP